MRVGIELTALELDRGGTARAIELLVGELKRDRSIELTEFRHAGSPGVARVARVARVKRGLYRELLYLRRQLPRAVKRSDVELLHCPSPLVPGRLSVPLVVTLHDVIGWDHPEWLGRANVLQLKAMLPRVLKRTARVITSSEYSRQRIIGIFDLAPERVVSVPLGIDERFTPGEPVTDVISRLQIDKPYVLTVGTLQPRKNIEAALHAFELLAAEGAPQDLVVVGARGWFDQELMSRLNDSSLAERVHVTGRVEDDELVDLYRGADCFVFPSRYEGFGFPPLEAMACGTPVVSSDRTSLKEVVGDGGLLVDPDAPGAIVDALRKVLESDDLRAQLRAAGIAHAATYRWARCAELTKAVYAQALMC